jgi:benzoate transport
MTDRIHETIDTGPMSRFQVVAVILCIALNMLDGYDVLVMAFTASSVAMEWGLSASQVGILLSAGLFGMAAGSLFIAPLADRLGRRAVILLCLVLVTVGMVLSSVSTGPVQLAGLRALTGLGIGGMLASLNVITSEYSSGRWRSATVSLQVTGYPLGATVGGIIGAWLLGEYGWRSMFLFGGVCSAVMIPAVLLRLPESLDYLLARRPPDALQKVNALLRKMDRQPASDLPEVVTETARASGVGSLFKEGLGGATLRIWGAFFLQMLSFYFVLSWTPRLLVQAGMSAQQGVTGGVLLNLGGIIGGSIFAWLSVKRGLKPLSIGCFLLTALTMAAYANVATAFLPAVITAALIGAVIFSAMASLYAMAPLLYPATIRSTGMGWSIGIGRIGAILAPITAGMLIDSGWESLHLYYVFAVPVLIAALAVRGLPVRCSWRVTTDSAPGHLKAHGCARRRRWRAKDKSRAF